ncbi:MAG: hypothetical protein QG670_2542, partial [Thermoproteota archaeon]|nr:hypothetical protein [Thermoproteota archaeon]
MKKNNFIQSHSRKSISFLALSAFVSIVWLIVRTGTKPSRISYPCQKAAVTNIYIFLAALGLSFVGFSSKLLPRRILKSRAIIAVMVTSLLVIMAVPTIGMFTTNPALEVNPTSVNLDLQPQIAATAASPSNLFIIQQAQASPSASLDAAMSALLSSMQSHDLSFFKTSSVPLGLIGSNDVIIIKVNGQSDQRGGTNTDLAKSLIKAIVNHPDGFKGEVVIADNGQSTGGVDMAESNAYDHSQSMTDVAGTFPTYKVSAYSWWAIAGNNATEYNSDNYQDGYVVNSTHNAATGVKVSYPKFRTAYGTYISLKNGVWNQSAETYDSSRL